MERGTPRRDPVDGRGVDMTLANRIDYKIAAEGYKEAVTVRARYNVQGTDKVMISLSWIHRDFIDDAGVLGRLLESMDQRAEEDAAHPDDILTAEFLCT